MLRDAGSDDVPGRLPPRRVSAASAWRVMSSLRRAAASRATRAVVLAARGMRPFEHHGAECRLPEWFEAGASPVRFGQVRRTERADVEDGIGGGDDRGGLDAI